MFKTLKHVAPSKLTMYIEQAHALANVQVPRTAYECLDGFQHLLKTEIFKIQD